MAEQTKPFYKYQKIPEEMKLVGDTGPVWENPIFSIPRLVWNRYDLVISRRHIYSNSEKDIGLLIFDKFIPKRVPVEFENGKFKGDFAEFLYGAENIDAICRQMELSPGDPLTKPVFFDPMQRMVVLYCSSDSSDRSYPSQNLFIFGEADLCYENNKIFNIHYYGNDNNTLLWGIFKREISDLIEFQNKTTTLDGDFSQGKKKHKNPAEVAVNKLYEILGKKIF